jgi:radical SAM protein with 4Fe4S-binding SPASM domain
VTPNLGEPIENFSSRFSYEELRDYVLPKLHAWGMNIKPVRYRSKDCGYVCWAGYEQLFISSEGIVYPCADLKVAIGNIATQTFCDIAKERFTELSKFMPTEIPACVTCIYHDYCDSCIGIAQIENGDFFKPSKHKCDLSKLQFERR